MKKLAIAALIFTLAGCESKPSEVALEICSSLQTTAETTFIAMQNGKPKSEVIDALNEIHRKGMMDELYQMIAEIVSDAYFQGKLTDQSELKSKAKNFAQKHYKSCLKNF